MNATPDPLSRHRFDVHAYRRMSENGALSTDARVELIDGEIIDMPPVGAPHGGIVDRLTERFVLGAHRRAIVRVQGSFELSRWSEPEPDLLLLVPREDYYRSRLPGPDDVLLLVEVADSSLERDRDIKRPLYAQGGIAEFWLIDVNAKSLTVHREPAADGYAVVHTIERAGTVAPAGLPDLHVALHTLF